MRDLDTLSHHPVTEQVVKVLCAKTQNNNPLFFRVLSAYYFSKVASMMNTQIKTHDRGKVPVNCYAMNLATSGQGKGYSTNIMEDMILGQFRERYLNETFPFLAEKHLDQLAVKRAQRKQQDPEVTRQLLAKEFEQAGPMVFGFDSGTTPAVKQMRHKLLMAGCGAVCLEIDEIGSNLLGQTEVLNTFLELFDVGKVKTKLVKSTSENSRVEEIDGRTPTNMMLFGTPNRLQDGARTEEEFMAMLDTGYARRCFFGYSRVHTADNQLSAAELYDVLTNNSTEQFIDQLADTMGQLADPINFARTLTMTREVSIEILEYKLHCERRAQEYPEHDEIRRTEMMHRFFKSMKLAGTYAFIDASPEITADHFYAAVKLAEESGEALNQLLNQPSNYIKLARFIAAEKRELTQADLMEKLPYYKGSQAVRADMMTLATSWGYKNNIVIKKHFVDGIEMLSGESLDETDLDKMLIAYSDHEAYRYQNREVPFDRLWELCQMSDRHWVNHHTIEGHRCEAGMRPGFNLVVIDVDGGVQLETAKLLLRDYKALYYTTKRHTAQQHRFRIVLPLNYTLQLNAEDFKEFMANIYEWLPFDCDKETGQRSKKWLSHPGIYEETDGQLLDALDFIPKTSKNEERKKQIVDLQSLTNLERWFVRNTGTGNRSNQLIKYALLLVDTGLDIDSIRSKVLALNDKLQDKLDEAEVMSTIMITATKAIIHREY